MVGNMNMNMKSKIAIREFVEGRDNEEVRKLENKCEIGSNKLLGVSIFTCMMGDPLCRIRFYPFHVMLVAEDRENRELVGVVRGCIKVVGTAFGGTFLKMGCILGLRVSPQHRRMGIGVKLVKSVEEWMVRKGAEYTFMATDESNKASRRLFGRKCKYVEVSSLVIVMHPLTLIPNKASQPQPQGITTEKVEVEEAIALYKKKVRGKDMYPADMEAILRAALSLGTWLSRFHDENSESWVMFSLWNTSEAYKLQVRKGPALQFIHSTLAHAVDWLFPRVKLPVFVCESVPFGFVFVYGLLGEGPRLGELLSSAWDTASRVARGVNCKAIVTELGASDPLIRHLPPQPSMSRINDVWYLKKLKQQHHDHLMPNLANVFVDPRDF